MSLLESRKPSCGSLIDFVTAFVLPKSAVLPFAVSGVEAHLVHLEMLLPPVPPLSPAAQSWPSHNSNKENSRQDQ